MGKKYPTKLLITGFPGTGKTTLIIKLAESLRHVQPAGFYTAESRKQGQRMGFELIGFDGRRRTLSHVDIKSPFKVGRYGVDVVGFESFIQQIDFFNPASSLMVIDEIGKMECFSTKFVTLLSKILDSDRPLIATISLKGTGPIAAIKQGSDIRLLTLTPANREFLFSDVLQQALNPYYSHAD